MSAPTELASLQVAIETELAALRGDMRQATDAVEEARRRIDRSLDKIDKDTKKSAASFARFKDVATKALGAFGLSLGAAAIVGGVTRLTRNSLALADSIDKTSQRLGVGVEFLQEFRFVASQSGVATNELELSLQRFLRRLGEAANTGKGELLPALRQLDVAVRDGNGNVRNGEEVFGEFLTKLSRVTDQTIKLSLAQKAFDSEGVKLIQIANLGADGIERLRKEARDLGIVLDTETVRELVRAQDEIDKLTTAIQSRFTLALGKAIAKLRDFNSELGVREGASRDDVARRLAEVFAERRRLLEIQEQVKNQPVESASVRESLDENLRIATELDAKLRELIAEEEKPKKPKKPAGGAGQARSQSDIDKERALFEQISQLAAASSEDQSVQAFLAAENRKRAIEENILDETRRAEAIRLSEEQLVRDLAEIEAEKAATRMEFEQQITKELLDARGDRLGVLRQETRDRLEEAKEQAEDAADFERLRTQILELEAAKRREIEEELAEEQAELRAKQREELQFFADELGRELGRLVETGEFSFRSLADAFEREFINRAIEKLVNSGLDLLIGGLGSGGGGGLGSLLGSLLGGGGGGGSSTDAVVSVASSAFSAAAGSGFGLPLPGFAQGGIVPAGARGLARFEGIKAEAVIPLDRIRDVLPGAVQGGGGGSGVIVQVFNGTGAKVRTPPMQFQGGRAIQRVLIGEMNEDLLRGGASARAIETRFVGVSRRTVER